MNIIFNGHRTAEAKASIKALLLEADKEFIPALSYRSSTTQKNLKIKNKLNSIEPYFKKVCEQDSFMVVENNKLAGFMSFRKGCDLESECIYLSTIIVSKDFRRKGVAEMLYAELLQKYNKELPIITRTWSTNNNHLELLKKLGFELIKCIHNDRGEGIHTVYYKKEV